LEACHEDIYINLKEACSRGDHELAREILESLGPELELIVNTTPGGGNTLLFSACEEGLEDIVRLLVEFKADGRIHPVTKYSPLYIACFHGRLSIVRLLLTKFPSLVNVETDERWLPIHSAAINNHVNVLGELLEFNYPPDIMISLVHHTRLYEYDFAFDMNSQNGTGETPLYIAAFLGNQSLVEALLKFRLSAKPLSQDYPRDSEDASY
jgi:ankyrin repeat protein